MKSRHAIALVGWYLMVPPTFPSKFHPVNLWAPLSEWRLGDVAYVFDSAAECKKQEAVAEKEAHAIADPKGQALACPRCWMMCVASDDPRLKGK
jgi:hypothetical protein